MNPLLTKAYKAEAAINAYRIVKPGANDDQVLQATGVGDALSGVSNEVGAAINERQDVIHGGIGEVACGGAVTRGDFLTSDANGKAVAAAPAAGVNNNVIGRALQSGVLDDVIRFIVAPGRIQG